jgi:hypothetical protein
MAATAVRLRRKIGKGPGDTLAVQLHERLS